MSYEIIAIPNFAKELKKLAKKYPSIKADFARLVEHLQDSPMQGKSLGNNCYKLRMAITSKGKGKSGGSRIITNLKVTKNSVYLLSIYDKSEKENISDHEIADLIKDIPD
jgi:mRNA-degrading endonuclease RelE of RelBE toxin-antitoxin system